MRHDLQFTAEKIAKRIDLIRPMVHRQRVALPPFRFMPLAGPEAPPPVAPDIDDSGWETIQPGSYWGRWEQDFVLRSSFRVPDWWNPDKVIALHLPLGEAGDIFTHPEALLYIDGHPHASSDRYHHDVDLPARVRDGAEHRIALHGYTGLSGWPPDPTSQTRLFMRQALLIEIDRDLETFVTLARTALDVSRRLPERDPAKHRILTALDAAFLALDTAPPMGRATYDSAPRALALLREGLAAAGPPLDVDLVAIGHAHMDIAYLWTVPQSRRKNGRTYSNVLGLMEAFEGYHFSHSQPQLYDYTRQDYPEVFAGMQARAREGRWEAMGGMWVEPDVNIAGAEALCRQLLLGRRFYEEHFDGNDTPVLWLPDTFGFPWALPQLMVQAGLRWFVTNKVSWNQYTRMPNQIFLWEGIDGTRVLSHLLTTPRPVQYLPYPTTYKAEMSAAEVLGTWENFSQKGTHSTLPICFGFGDGGGGPTRELVVAAQSYAKMPGAPRVRMGTVREVFEALEARGTEDLPVWADEINLELHRGVLTSQADMKRHNRRNETLLHDAEWLAALSAEDGTVPYPHAAFDEAWKLLCKLQFHDILPGTSIGAVFEEAREDYDRINDLAMGPLITGLQRLAARMPEGARYVAANPAPFGGTRIARVTGERDLPPLRCMADGSPVPAQRTRWGTLLEVPEVPAYGWAALAPGEAVPPPEGLSVREEDGAPVLESDFYRLRLAPGGTIASLIDKAAGDREVLTGPGNAWQTYEDRPINWDAWDVDAFFEDRPLPPPELQRMEVVETGPIRATVRLEWTYKRSRIRQHVSLWRTSRRIDFETEIDWRERHTLLKVAFPVSVHAPNATYDVQFGQIERPTHRSTLRDFARFEVCAHKWADLSEGDYGVALLNDCKYGHDVRGAVLRLSLLKSATMPNPEADQGAHRFTYSLMPHLGDWRGAVQREGYHLQDPLLLAGVDAGTGDLPAMGAPVAVEPDSVILETVKRAEDGRGTILRLWESRRTRGPCRIRFDRPMSRVELTDVLEGPGEVVGTDAREVTIPMTPYRIVTLRCEG